MSATRLIPLSIHVMTVSNLADLPAFPVALVSQEILALLCRAFVTALELIDLVIQTNHVTAHPVASLRVKRMRPIISPALILQYF